MNNKEKAKMIYFMYKIKEKEEMLDGYIPDKLEEISNYIRSGFYNLKRCDTIDTRFDIELDIFDRASKPGALWQSRLVSIYQIYATIIGVLDARYDKYNSDLDWANDFHNEEDIKLCKENISLIIDKRNKIIKDYYEITPHEESDSIKKAVSQIPSHKGFTKLCSDLPEKFNKLPGEFMKFYLLGYNGSLYFREDDILKLYNDLVANYEATTLKKEYHRNLVRKLIPKDNN